MRDRSIFVFSTILMCCIDIILLYSDDNTLCLIYQTRCIHTLELTLLYYNILHVFNYIEYTLTRHRKILNKYVIPNNGTQLKYHKSFYCN